MSFWSIVVMAITHSMSWGLFVPYGIGAVAGSVNGQMISMKIEKVLKLTRDAHLEKDSKKTTVA